MNNMNPRKRQDYSTMSVELLEELLETELNKQNVDEDKVFEILSEIKKNEDISGAVTYEMETALDRYQHRIKKRREQEDRPAKGIAYWKRFAVAVVSVLLLVMVVPPVMGAENIVELVGRWTDDIFQLLAPDEPQRTEEYTYQTDNPALQQLYYAVAELGADEPIVPMWLPEGCAMVEFKVSSAREKPYVFAQFEDSSQYFVITFKRADNDTVEKFHKMSQGATVIDCGGIEHYVIVNNENTTAAWAQDGIVCYVASTYDYNTICRILMSIYGEK